LSNGEKKSNSKATISHSVQETMTRCNQEEINPQNKRSHSGNAVTKEHNYDAGHQSGED